METRGTFGFKKTANEYNRDDIFVVYNHYDSHYEGLGTEILKIYLSLSQEQLINIFNNIDWINQGIDSHYPNNQCKFRLSHVFDPDRGRITLNNEKEFFNDGFLCEYSYLYNLETDCLEFYKGFCGEPQEPYLKKYAVTHKFDEELAKALGMEPEIVYHTHKTFELNREDYFKKMFSIISNLEEEVDNLNLEVDELERELDSKSLF